MTRWQILQSASSEIRNLLLNHDELRRADAQEVLQDWVEAQSSDASPEILCAKLVKALSDVTAFCQAQTGPVKGSDLRTALRSALGVPDSKRPSQP